jgi:hypothetical protein
MPARSAAAARRSHCDLLAETLAQALRRKGFPHHPQPTVIDDSGASSRKSTRCVAVIPRSLDGREVGC